MSQSLFQNVFFTNYYNFNLIRKSFPKLNPEFGVHDFIGRWDLENTKSHKLNIKLTTCLIRQ